MRAKKNEPVSPIVVIAKTKDVGLVKFEIHEKYGFWVTDEYAADLIAFVYALVRGE